MEFVYPFRELPYVLVVSASFLFFFGMFLPFTFIILSAEHDGMSSELANYLVPILNAGKSHKSQALQSTQFLSRILTVISIHLWQDSSRLDR